MMMKNKVSFFQLLIVFLFFSCSKDADISIEVPEQQQARSRQDVVNILNRALTSNQVITGQHCGDGLDQNASFYNSFVEQLAAQTNKYVGMVGADIGFVPSNTYPIQTLINHWNEGGLVSMSWHLDNPFTDGYNFRFRSVEDGDVINFLSLIKNAPDSEAKNNYRAELDKVANTLRRLKDAGVIVIWRPLHEMNGNWFWWGINEYNNTQTNTTDFITFWRDMYDTLTNDYGLDNLLWAYSVAEFFGWNADVMAYYPGSNYVDIVGVDYYGTTPNFPDFEILENTGKITALTEAGPSSEAYGDWDENALINTLRGKAAYFLQWHSWPGANVSIIDNLNAGAMMSSSTAITRDELE